jgi:hypothetical protein
MILEQVSKFNFSLKEVEVKSKGRAVKICWEEQVECKSGDESSSGATMNFSVVRAITLPTFIAENVKDILEQYKPAVLRAMKIADEDVTVVRVSFSEDKKTGDALYNISAKRGDIDKSSGNVSTNLQTAKALAGGVPETEALIEDLEKTLLNICYRICVHGEVPDYRTVGIGFDEETGEITAD